MGCIFKHWPGKPHADCDIENRGQKLREQIIYIGAIIGASTKACRILIMLEVNEEASVARAEYENVQI